MSSSSKQTTLTIAGDATALVKAFDKAGAAAKEMAGDLDKSSGEVKAFGKSMDNMNDHIDTSEGKFIGIADLAGGLGDLMGNEVLGQVSGLGLAFADMAGGFVATVGPAISGLLGKLGLMTAGTAAQAVATEGATVAQTGLNVAMLANPIGLIVAGVALLVGGFIILWTKVDGFKEAIIAAWEKVKGFIPGLGLLGDAVAWVADKMGFGGDETTKMSEEMKAALEKSKADWQKWNDDVTAEINDIINPLHRARDDSKVTLGEIQKNLTDNVAFYGGWIRNLNTLTERGFGELATYLHTLGPEAEKAVGEAVSMTDPQLKKMQENITGNLQKAGSLGGDLLMNGIVDRNYEGLGGDVADRFMTGVERNFTNDGPALAKALIDGWGNIVPTWIDGWGNPIAPPKPMPKRAMGGPIDGMALVGERGPELFVGQGTIVPNHQLGSGGSTYNITVQAWDTRDGGAAVVAAIKEYERGSGDKDWRNN